MFKGEAMRRRIPVPRSLPAGLLALLVLAAVSACDDEPTDRTGPTDPPAGAPVFTLAPDTLACLEAYAYPGNVRELRNILQRASLLCDGDTLQVRHLPVELHSPPTPEPAALPRPRHEDAEPSALRSATGLSDAELTAIEIGRAHV